MCVSLHSRVVVHFAPSRADPLHTLGPAGKATEDPRRFRPGFGNPSVLPWLRTAAFASRRFRFTFELPQAGPRVRSFVKTVTAYRRANFRQSHFSAFWTQGRSGSPKKSGVFNGKTVDSNPYLGPGLRSAGKGLGRKQTQVNDGPFASFVHDEGMRDMPSRTRSRLDSPAGGCRGQRIHT